MQNQDKPTLEFHLSNNNKKRSVKTNSFYKMKNEKGVWAKYLGLSSGCVLGLWRAISSRLCWRGTAFCFPSNTWTFSTIFSKSKSNYQSHITKRRFTLCFCCFFHVQRANSLDELGYVPVSICWLGLPISLKSKSNLMKKKLLGKLIKSNSKTESCSNTEPGTTCRTSFCSTETRCGEIF